MNLHEYQAKALLKAHGCPVPEGRVVSSEHDAAEAYDALGLTKAVVKAQVHAGGRGKAGGVKLTDDKASTLEVVRSLLGTNLVTYQTTAKGQPVHQVLIETPSVIQKELYLGAVVDRAEQNIVFMASTEGGVEIETVAEETPEKILQTTIDPLVGFQPFQARQMGFALGLTGPQIKQFTRLMHQLAALFIDRDLSMLEINPLIITDGGDLVCLDAKINLDENALYRQSELAAQRDASQEDEREAHAQRFSLNYIALEGDIGCMVNGAGLAMATMDLIKLHGGSPANFLDVGGGATQERVTEAFKIILSDDQVKAVLVNIFGGIVRCDLIAEGIIAAVAEVGIEIPVVVRLEGNNAELGLKALEDSGLNIIAAPTFDQAAERVVKAAQEG